MLKFISYNGLVRLLSAFFNFLIVVVLSRFFGAAVKGEATLLLTNISFFVLFSGIIGGNSLFVLHHDFSPRYLLLRSYVWAAVVSAVGFLLLWLLGAFSFGISLHTATLALLFSFTQVNLNFLLAQKKYKLYNLFTILPVFLTFSVLSIVYFFAEEKLIFSFISALYIAYVLTVAASFMAMDKSCFSEEGAVLWNENFRGVIYQGLAFQFTDILLLLNFRLYFYLLNHFQSTTDLGYYSTGISLLEIAWLFSRSFFTYTLSEKNTSIHAYNQKLKKYLPVAVGISVGYIALLYILPESVYGMVFGSYFRAVVYSVKWSVPGIIVLNLFLCLLAYFLQKKAHFKVWTALLLGLAVQFGVCTRLIHHYYYSGASIAASASFIAASFILAIFYLMAAAKEKSV